MLNLEERTKLEHRLHKLMAWRTNYTKMMTCCEEDQVETIVQLLNEIYEGIRLSKKQLGHLKGIKKRRVSIAQAMKFRQLYSEVA